MAQEARVWHEKADDKYEDEWCDPCRYSVIKYGEVRVCTPCLYGLAREQKEDPNARADCCAIQAEYVALKHNVSTAWQISERSGEQENGHYRAMFGFEAFEKRDERDGV